MHGQRCHDCTGGVRKVQAEHAPLPQNESLGGAVGPLDA
jgi:hypothetical protein